MDVTVCVHISLKCVYYQKKVQNNSGNTNDFKMNKLNNLLFLIQLTAVIRNVLYNAPIHSLELVIFIMPLLP